MGYFGSEGIYDSNLSFWAKKFKKNFWTQRNFWRMHQLHKFSFTSNQRTAASENKVLNSKPHNIFWMDF